MSVYIVYILYSSSLDKYYVGYTSDLEDRIRKHNSNHRGFTGKGNHDWELKWQEYELKRDAMKREKQPKNWKSRQLLEQLIDGV
ncbi:Excinuclease ABC C subunit domain protein [Pseudopedobacter saltans DSM 12145]|uniref:Excinuclease ABC C subunit domain protein n=1 Tax=Pseudopedobacter saltans (strain ATCC 51119 / DSM 12145 / JCM 21818 / CCUG 39354 / LMG 10337 / NBRC 100064 / NCIMB 13643) TaxID=762903 RepID=F0S4Q9_PSESL|nr:GIY-YIG nuclease family protein [Pseudopedobacter saltans]ADY53077.1 Excinuclease ABC C subunit domain protein [Pseudopedobacter saltans DSM 12145]